MAKCVWALKPYCIVVILLLVTCIGVLWKSTGALSNSTITTKPAVRRSILTIEQVHQLGNSLGLVIPPSVRRVQVCVESETQSISVFLKIRFDASDAEKLIMSSLGSRVNTRKASGSPYAAAWFDVERDEHGDQYFSKKASCSSVYNNVQYSLSYDVNSLLRVQGGDASLYVETNTVKSNMPQDVVATLEMYPQSGSMPILHSNGLMAESEWPASE